MLRLGHDGNAEKAVMTTDPIPSQVEGLVWISKFMVAP